jgi:hypothetical protein
MAANRWENIGGAGYSDYTAPGDLDQMAINSWHELYNQGESEHSAINVYVDDGHGSRAVPFQRTVTGGGRTGVLEFRFVFGADPRYAQWLDPVVALRSGQWDRDNYIKNTYLPSLKWRVVVIPQAN